MDQKSTLQQLFTLAENIYKSFYHVIFIEVCKSYQIFPDGLYVEKEPCIGNLSNVWKSVFKVGADFKSVFAKHVVEEDWLWKVSNHLVIIWRDWRKNTSKEVKKCVHFVRTIIFVLNVWKDLRVTMNFFSFKYNFVSFCKSVVPDFDNLHYLLTLNDTSDESTWICNSCKT